MQVRALASGEGDEAAVLDLLPASRKPSASLPPRRASMLNVGRTSAEGVDEVTVLMEAAETGNVPVVRALLRHVLTCGCSSLLHSPPNIPAEMVLRRHAHARGTTTCKCMLSLSCVPRVRLPLLHLCNRAGADP